MPGSAPDFRDFISNYMRHLKPDAQILDIGAGAGTYADLLPAFANMDAIEIYRPYIKQYELEKKYRHVYVGDACQLIDTLPHDYWVVILGAVLEHLPLSHAQRLVESAIQKAALCIFVTVPFETKQGPVGGNIWETHIQDEITPDYMAAHFPILEPVMINERRGLYTAQGWGAIPHEN